MIKSISSANMPLAKSETFEPVSHLLEAAAGGAVIKVEEMDDADKDDSVELEQRHDQSLTSPSVDCKRSLTRNCAEKLKRSNPAHPILEKIIKMEPGIYKTDDDDVPHHPQREDNFTATKDSSQSISAHHEKANADSNSEDGQEQQDRIMFGEVKVFPGPAISLKTSSSWMKNNDRISSSQSEAATPAVVNQYACKTCNKTFRTNGQLSTHICTKSAPRKLTCQYCGARFDRKQFFDKHLKYMSEWKDPLHPREAPSSSNPSKTKFGAETAAAVAGSSIKLRDKKSKNGQASGIPSLDYYPWKKHLCKYCSKRFATTHGRDSHQNAIHLGIRHNCPKCEKTFSENFYLYKHLRKYCKNNE